MLFSIVVPVFNAKAFLRNCLNSILIQSFANFEVIAIDDGSTDGSSEILEYYASKDPRIHVYHFDNAGVSYSRRRGIALASGEYIVFVDSDDTINSDLLSSLYDAIIKNDFPTLIRYQANLIGDAVHKDHERYNFKEFLNSSYSGINALKHWSLPGKKYAVYWLFAFKKSIFSKVLFTTDLRCYEDVDLIPILVAASENVVTIEYIGYNYTCNNTKSLTNTRSEAAERSRALDFIQAYNYAISNFTRLDNVSSLDIAFFIEDYTRRLKGKFDSLPDNLKAELAEHFKM